MRGGNHICAKNNLRLFVATLHQNWNVNLTNYEDCIITRICKKKKKHGCIDRYILDMSGGDKNQWNVYIFQIYTQHMSIDLTLQKYSLYLELEASQP